MDEVNYTSVYLFNQATEILNEKDELIKQLNIKLKIKQQKLDDLNEVKSGLSNIYNLVLKFFLVFILLIVFQCLVVLYVFIKNFFSMNFLACSNDS